MNQVDEYIVKFTIIWFFFMVEKLAKIFQQLIATLFSDECRLTSLELDFVCGHDSRELHQCLTPQNQIYCPNLRNLRLHIQYTILLENLIDYVPVLQKLSVSFYQSLYISPRSSSEIKDLIKTIGNWSNKVRIDRRLTTYV